MKTELSDLFEIKAPGRLLFHGSGIPGIREFKPSQSVTFGTGLYLTSQSDKADAYARLRAESEYNGELAEEGLVIPEMFTPIVYEFKLGDQRLVDFRTQDAMNALFPQWISYLGEHKEELVETIESAFMQKHVKRQVEQKVTQQPTLINRDAFIGNQGPLNGFFTRFLTENGFDGLVCIEGGEGAGKQEIGKHDSYVIFKPEQLALVGEYTL